MERIPPFLTLLALLLAACFQTAWAADSSYTYDELGRLTGVTSDAGTTTYVYDPSGNILKVAGTAAPGAPNIGNVSAQPLRSGTPATISIAGSGLEGATIIPPDGFSISNLQYTKNGLTFTALANDGSVSV